MSAATTLAIVVEPCDPATETERPKALALAVPTVIPSVDCISCEGLGVVDVSLPHQHPVERTCSACDGTGIEPVALYEADDADSEQIHVWRTERAYFTDAAPLCGADVTDTSAHVVGKFPHCTTCFAAKEGFVK